MLVEQPRRRTSRFGKQGNKRIGTGDFRMTNLLSKEHGTLIDALERRRGLGASGFDHGVLEFVVEILQKASPQLV